MASSLIRRTSGTGLCPLIFNSKTCRFNLKVNSFCGTQFELLHKGAANQITAIRFLSVSTFLNAESSTPSSIASTSSTSHHNIPAVKQELPLDKNKDRKTVFRERYIPVRRQSIIHFLSEEKDLLSEEEKKLLPDFVRSLDTVLVTRYHGILEELKTLFDPINPDKETMKTREWTRKEKLDNEFWLLQKIEDVMAKANFHELPRKKIDNFLKDHDSEEGVRVSVDPNRYDVLRFWVLGHDIPELKSSLPQRVFRSLLRRGPTKPKEYFKRVVVALRLKKDSKLMLKAFKEVPIKDLQMLLPDGTIRMRTIDQGLFATSAAIAGFGLLAKLVTVLASENFDWTLAVTLVTGIFGFRVWSTYRNRRNSYLLDVSRMLYFKNIANNRGLLTMLVDRAEDESLKEAVLAYIFLLTSSKGRKTRSLFAKLQADGLSRKELESRIQKWLEEKTGVMIEIDSAEAIQLIQSLGLLIEKDNKYQVLELDVAAKLLPQTPPLVIVRRETETGVADGDRDDYLETDSKYKSEDVKMRRYGWF